MPVTTTHTTPKAESITDLIPRLKKQLPSLKHKYAIRTLGIFGSYLRNEQNSDSDLDILVELDNDSMSLIEFIELELQLSDLLGVKVDLVEKSTLKPALGKRILQEVQIL